MMDSPDYNTIFALKTKQLAIMIIKEFSKLPPNEAFSVIRKQIFRSSTSMAANYRAMCRARSKAERFSKISIVIEETDETLFWLEMLEELEYVQKEIIADIKTKTEEILKVTSSYRKMLRTNFIIDQLSFII